MVRRRAGLGYIEDDKKRRVSFSKRRSGLMKKARELSVMCNVDVGVIVFSGTGRLFQFASSSMSDIITRYNLATTPLAPEPQPDLSPLVTQQAEEIRSLKEELATLESKNKSLLKELEKHVGNKQPICFENDNLETALTLRPPSSNADLSRQRCSGHRVPMLI